ncbi:MAG: S8 family serine peptidase [bacterium]
MLKFASITQKVKPMCQITKTITILISFMVFVHLSSCDKWNEPPEPTTDLGINFINLPQAWRISKGQKVHLGIVSSETDTTIDWVKNTAELAPRANVTGLSKIKFLSLPAHPVPYNIILILESINPAEYDDMLNSIEYCTSQNVAIFLPAYFGPMRKDYDYSRWREFVQQASKIGAIVVGTHGTSYQLGDLSFWRDMPVDVFAVHRNIRSGGYLDSDALIEQSLEESAYLVAGVAALMVSKEPDISPIQIKQRFKERGRKIRWVVTEPRKRAYPTWNGKAMDEVDKKIKSSKVVETFEGTCLDAGLVLGLEPLVNGEWCLQVLNAKKAHSIATGKGVTVAILDWLFKQKASCLKGRTVKPGSVVEDSVFDVRSPLGHGTWMADALVKVAPDVKIMPVRVHPYRISDDYWNRQYPKNLINGIEYAIKNGANIISISSPGVPDEWQEKFDEVAQKAVSAGLTIVYIHYYGQRKDVVVSRPIEFASKNREYVYVVGTGFINEYSFPNIWGFSQTAPVVAGVVAMMKEINPQLKPAEIRQILLKSGKKIKSGYEVLDAHEALQNVNLK